MGFLEYNCRAYWLLISEGICTRQEEYISPFAFTMYLNNLLKRRALYGASGAQLVVKKCFTNVLGRYRFFTESATELQISLNNLNAYYNQWANTICFRKGKDYQNKCVFNFRRELI